MIPYLVKGTVYRTDYMSEEKEFQDIRIVMAENENEALTKYEDFWSCQTEEYSVYYHVSGNVMETIR
jgi:hypothetical protein